MKVVHVLNNYLPQQVAGTEVYTAALVRELKRQNIESVVVIPRYAEKENAVYYFEGVEVIQFAEPSIADRDLIAGKKAPAGLQHFSNVLTEANPDIVHFHELAGSIGIGVYHVQEAKKAGYNVLMTFHIAKYTCRTGTLMYMNETKCDGVIRRIRCSKCWLNDKGEKGIKAAVLTTGFTLTNFLNIDTRFLQNGIGTALAFPKIISEKKDDLMALQENTNRFIVLTEWYKNILLKNNVDERHITVIQQGIPNAATKHEQTIHSDTRLRLIFIGRINHFKGPDLLLRALKQLSPNDVALDIYGKTDDEAYWKSCTDVAAGLTNVRFMGSLEPGLVIDTIRNYDLLCIPSAVSEMGPLVLKEAFAAGVPVIASDVYGNAEQVAHGVNGWLFKFKDAHDLRVKLQALIDERSLVTRAAANLTAVRSFEAVGMEHAALYKQILSPN